MRCFLCIRHNLWSSKHLQAVQSKSVHQLWPYFTETEMPPGLNAISSCRIPRGYKCQPTQLPPLTWLFLCHLTHMFSLRFHVYSAIRSTYCGPALRGKTSKQECQIVHFCVNNFTILHSLLNNWSGTKISVRLQISSSLPLSLSPLKNKILHSQLTQNKSLLLSYLVSPFPERFCFLHHRIIER